MRPRRKGCLNRSSSALITCVDGTSVCEKKYSAPITYMDGLCAMNHVEVFIELGELSNSSSFVGDKIETQKGYLACIRPLSY